MYDNAGIEQKIFKECLWYNDKIQINKPLLLRNVIDVDNFIWHILGENKEFLSHNELVDHYNIYYSFSEYLSVWIPMTFEWRKIIRERQKPEGNRYTLTIYRYIDIYIVVRKN